MKARKLRVVGVLALALLPQAVLAWSSAGHQAVGAIADRLLEGTHAGGMVRKTLGGMSLETVAVWADCVKGASSKDGVNFSYQPNPQRFAECVPFNTPAEEARILAFVKANWQQCGSAQGNEWCHNQYHYADIAPQRDHYDPHYAGSNDHDVVHAIPAMIAVLKGSKPPAPFAIADKREALMLLSHYIGDLHQPLHVESIYLDAQGQPVDPDAQGLDPRTETAGGNQIYDGNKRLHAYWDSIPERMAVNGESFAETLARARRVALSPGDASGWAAQWASEVVQTGRAAYAGLSYAPRAPQEAGPSTPAWDAKGIDAAYFKRSEQLKQAELALAGARLAQTIQAVWPEPVAKQAKGGVPLRLIAFNDFHGNLEGGDLTLSWQDPLIPEQGFRLPVGGAAALSGMVGTLRKGVPNSLLLSSGDLFGASPLASTLFRHESTVMVMNRIGVDVGIVGNHEFDAGLAEIKRLEKGGCAATTPADVAVSCASGSYPGMAFPLLGGNVVKADSGKPAFAPYVIKRIQGIPVAFIGVVTRDTPNVVVKSVLAGLRFDDEADTINRTAARLKKQGVKALVAMIHEGGDTGSEAKPADWNDIACPDARGAIFEINKRISKEVDVVFSAHTHKGYRCLIDGRIVVQATNYGRGVSVVDLMFDPRTKDVDRSRTMSINLPVVSERTTRLQRLQVARVLPPAYSSAILASEPDEGIAKQVAAYVAAVAPKAEKTVARITADFKRGDTRADSSAGRLIADAQLAAASDAGSGGAVIAFLNEGGIRANLACKGTPPCAVSFGQVFSAQPFGNTLVVMSLRGAQIKTALEQQQSAGMNAPRFLQPSRGFSYDWQDSAPPGERVSRIMLDGRLIDMSASYRVAVNNFLSEGGDGFLVFRDGTQRVSAGQDLDALLDYLKPSLSSDQAIFTPDPHPRVNRQP